MARRRRQPQQNRRKDRRQPPAGAGLYEAAILPGLAPFATRELDRLGARLLGSEEDSLRFSYSGDEERLNRLRRVTAVYRVLQFAVPRRSEERRVGQERRAGWSAAPHNKK